MQVTIINYMPANNEYLEALHTGSGEYMIVSDGNIQMRTTELCDECGMIDAITRGWDTGYPEYRGEEL